MKCLFKHIISDRGNITVKDCVKAIGKDTDSLYCGVAAETGLVFTELREFPDVI